MDTLSNILLVPILRPFWRNLNNLEHAVSISKIRIIFPSNSWHQITSFFSAAQFPTPPITFRRFIFDMPRERWTVVPQGGYDPPRGYTSQRASKALNSTNSFTAEYKSCRVATDTANWQFTSGSTRSARVEVYIGIEPMTRWLTANCSTTELISQIGVELTPHLHSGCSLHNGSIGFIMVYIHSDKSTGTFAAVFSQDL